MQLRSFKKMPSVGAVMTPFPYSVQPADPVAEAERLMADHGIRHVPVQEDSRVVGIISDRDLERRMGPDLSADDKTRIRAQDVLSRDPFIVEIGTPLAEVIVEMAERRIGSAIVLRHGRLAGILSLTDVCFVLAELLDELFPGPDSTDAA